MIRLVLVLDEPSTDDTVDRAVAALDAAGLRLAADLPDTLPAPEVLP